MSTSSPAPRLTVAVATRNRFDLLIRCVESLRWLTPLPLDIIVIDDASDEPIEGRVRSHVGPDFPWPIRFLRTEVQSGCLYCRNVLAREANAPFILSLDDDGELIDEGALAALELIETDPKVGAVACTQIDHDGRAWPSSMQPASVDYISVVRSFQGNGCIMRRDVFVELEGYREMMQSYGEEKDYCKRLLNRGYSVVYIPEYRVMHHASPVGRNELLRMRHSFRNSCYDAIWNEPFPMPLLTVPIRFYHYIGWRKVHCKYYGLSDRGGLWSIALEVLCALPKLLRDRRALRWSTYRRWKQLGRECPSYVPSSEKPSGCGKRGERMSSTERQPIRSDSRTSPPIRAAANPNPIMDCAGAVSTPPRSRPESHREHDETAHCPHADTVCAPDGSESTRGSDRI